MKTRFETKEQLELTFDAGRLKASTPPAAQKRAQAHWWFGKMRQIVDLAMGPRQPRCPRPEQTYLPLAQKTVWH
jgi:hypothetical protein